MSDGRPLDAAAHEVFRKKGDQNAVKVRRVLQATRDLLGRDLAGARVLDLGCGEGVYSIEAGLAGARVLAVDGRAERLDDGRAIAARHGLANVEFRVADVRALRREEVGGFDVVWFLGLLYHLDVPDAFTVMENVHAMCDRLLVVDTHVADEPKSRAEHKGVVYEGDARREHGAQDDAAKKQARLGASLDNPSSFWFTKDSLLRLLHEVGFTSAYECFVPREPGKRADRVTIVAVKGGRRDLATYPWINGQPEDAIAKRIEEIGGWKGGYWTSPGKAPPPAKRSWWSRERRGTT